MKEMDLKAQRSSLEERIIQLRPDFLELVSKINLGELNDFIKILAANNSDVPKHVNLFLRSYSAEERTKTFLDYLTNFENIIGQVKEDIGFEQGPDDQAVVFLLGLLDDRQYEEVVDKLRQTWKSEV